MAEYIVRVGRGLPGTGIPVDPQEVVVDTDTPSDALAQAVDNLTYEKGGTWVGLSVYLRVWAWYEVTTS